MSKRGSRNAINFAGKNWGHGRIKSSKNKRKRKKSLAEVQFTELCQKFDFNEQKYPRTKAKLESEFNTHKSRKRKEILKKADLYKKYCKKNKIELNIVEFLLDRIYNKKFYLKTQTTDKKEKGKTKTNGNRISDFLSNEIILKLKNLNKK